MWYVFFYIFIDIVLLSKMSRQPAILPPSVHNFAACLIFRLRAFDHICMKKARYKFFIIIIVIFLIIRFNNDKEKQHKLRS